MGEYMTREEQNRLVDEFYENTLLVDDEDIDWHDETGEEEDPDE